MAGTPGLQNERTALAWQRSGLAGSVVASVALVLGARDGRWWVVVPVGALALGAAVAAALAARSGAHAGRAGGPGPWRRLVATAAGTSAAAAAGVLLALVALAR